MDDPIDVDELRARVVEHRRERGLSLRAASSESGVPLNTLSRVEKGYLPDLTNFTRLVSWMGLDLSAILRGPQRIDHAESTTDTIRASLRSDPYLTEQAATQIADLVNNLYASLATPGVDAQVHLRAENTFTPAAAQQLGGILEDLHTALLADDALGSRPGWD